MFKNYIKIAFRNIIKQKAYSIINISGLAIGMACTFLILLWVQDELSFDKFHQNVNRLYRVLNHEEYTPGDAVTFTSCAPGLAPVLKSEIPEIQETVRCRSVGTVTVQYDEKIFNEEDFIFTDPSFLQMFSFKLIHGDKEQVLSSPASVVITQEMAQKYFDSENPIGKTLRIDNRFDLTVSGIIQNSPSNSYFEFNFLANFDKIKEFGYPVEGWDVYGYPTFVMVGEHTDLSLVNEKIVNITKKYDAESIVTLSLQPVADMHLYSGPMLGKRSSGDIKYVYIFSIIAGFILLIACINFMNLTTARSGNRTKEVGIRKVVGARRNEVVTQFFGESVLLSIISLIFALNIVSFAVPFFNSISGKEITFYFVDNSLTILVFLSIAIITGFISGSYPALFLSAFNPTKVLKGSLKSGVKSSTFRKILVTTQFVLTISLIIGTFIINKQMHFIKNQKLGFEKDQVIYIHLKEENSKKLDFLRNKFKEHPHIVDVSGTSYLPTAIRHSTIMHEWDGRQENEQFLIHMLSADHDLLKTMKFEMAEGRYFSREILSDTLESAIFNEAAIKMMNMDSPLGKKTMFGTIIGVMKNYHFESLHSPIAPMVVYFDPRRIAYLLVKVESDDIENSIKAMESTWKETFPNTPFDFSFLDEQIDKLYKVEYRTGKIIDTFTFLALFIAGLGLFGLASYTTEQRTKEVGIRKVLGASVLKLVFLLSKEFSAYVLLANIIAWPLAWFAMNKWLQNFAYHTDLSWWIFIVSGIAALAIALLTVSWQAIRAAMANPVESLKYE